MSYNRTGGSWVHEYTGLSGDTKPVDDEAKKVSVPNGSTFLEMDTSDVYIYDKQNKTWRKL